MARPYHRKTRPDEIPDTTIVARLFPDLTTDGVCDEIKASEESPDLSPRIAALAASVRLCGFVGRDGRQIPPNPVRGLHGARPERTGAIAESIINRARYVSRVVRSTR